MIIGICDDQEIYRDEIICHCKNMLKQEAVTYECFASGEELLASGLVCDFLFLYIELDGLDGIRVK